jgi:hypothetical protein
MVSIINPRIKSIPDSILICCLWIINKLIKTLSQITHTIKISIYAFEFPLLIDCILYFVKFCRSLRRTPGSCTRRWREERTVSRSFTGIHDYAASIQRPLPETSLLFVLILAYKDPKGPDQNSPRNYFKFVINNSLTVTGWRRNWCLTSAILPFVRYS